jgi:hypothetical protein
MTPSPSFDFPGGRFLAAWWKQLAPLRPKALWMAHLVLHRVEALVRRTKSIDADVFTQLTLRALADGESEAGVEALLSLDRQVVGRMLNELREQGLADKDNSASWTLTGAGREALTHGRYQWSGHERQVLHFVENEAGRPPHFLHLLQPCTLPWSPAGDWSFDVGLLIQCTEQSSRWKLDHGFPSEIETVLGLRDSPAIPPLQRIVVDWPCYLPAALVLAPAEDGERLLGFAVQTDGWVLQQQQVAFVVTADRQEVFPDLANPPGPEQWRNAWQRWCQRRGIPDVEAEQSALEHTEHRIRIRTPGRLIERLRSARSEAFKGEAWLLAGTGRIRMAAQIELRS